MVELVAFDADGNPIGDQCYTLVGVSGSFGPFCDNGEGDAAADPGVLTVQGLPVGTYEAVLETVDEARRRRASPASQAAAIRVGAPRRPADPDHLQHPRPTAAAGRSPHPGPRPGWQLSGGRLLRVDPEWRNRAVRRGRDNRGDDENSADGRILLASIRAGRYTLTQTTAPTGYSTAADQSVRIAAGSVREVAVTNQAEPERTANLDVETTDGEGNALPGACYAIMRVRPSKPATMMTTESPGSPVFHPAATSCARSSRQRVATPQQAPRPRVSTPVSRRR